MDRRSFLLSSFAVGAAGALGACATGPTTGSDPAPQRAGSAEPGAFPVTIEHAFGTTTITREPRRVVCLGTSDADSLLALGVVPVGATKIGWGGNADGSTPWFDAALEAVGGRTPTRVDDSDSIPFDDVAALAPDLVLVTNYALTRSDYGRLAKVADVVAYPGDAWTTTWQQSLEMVGKAVGRPAAAAQVRRETDGVLARVRARHPELAGRSFVWAAISATDLSSIPFYTPQDARPRLLTEVGMVNAPVVERLAEAGQFYGTVSAERAADLRSDLLITYAEDEAAARTIIEDPLIRQIPAVAAGHVLAAVDQVDALSGTTPSPLAIPWAARHWFPHVAAALGTVVVS